MRPRTSTEGSVMLRSNTSVSLRKSTNAGGQDGKGLQAPGGQLAQAGGPPTRRLQSTQDRGADPGNPGLGTRR